jgi:mRNA interferase RelE/StbE
MSWTVAWASSAVRDLRRLDRKLVERILGAVERFAEDGHGDVKRLQGCEEYRLRIGDWRVRFALEPASKTMTVLHVSPRGSAYR